ncbi:hypothetical protein P7K49_021840 [Saguinus oedipus]|uniref:Centriolar satellite-associated tubulin polyglutamylase complex regulator 1 n=1 Tax=Saguinus oedipus TaxID=9490 RepID=A0ABQ9UW62_SAGOE|nr:hypothetical protein P7K49_021840 [Saguinus oedipus]
MGHIDFPVLGGTLNHRENIRLIRAAGEGNHQGTAIRESFALGCWPDTTVIPKDKIQRRGRTQRHVLTYMEDAVCQLLENREDINQYGIARFFTE